MKNFELSHLSLVVAVIAFLMKFAFRGTSLFLLSFSAGLFLSLCAFVMGVAGLLVSKNKTYALAGMGVSVLAFFIGFTLQI